MARRNTAHTEPEPASTTDGEPMDPPATEQPAQRRRRRGRQPGSKNKRNIEAEVMRYRSKRAKLAEQIAKLDSDTPEDVRHYSMLFDRVKQEVEAGTEVAS